MKILQFAFGDNMPESDYITHHHAYHFFVYTGTHDNNTVKGWWRKDAPKEMKLRLQRYAGRQVQEDEIAHFLCREAFSSVARTAIIPVQDLLSLDESAKMNTPASAENNWLWRLKPGQLNADAEQLLKEWSFIYNRDQ
jgi:4-alpha-glucanotransferase